MSSTIIGTIMGLIVPGGAISGRLAGMLVKPGAFFYKLVFNSILMIVILLLFVGDPIMSFAIKHAKVTHKN